MNATLLLQFPISTCESDWPVQIQIALGNSLPYQLSCRYMHTSAPEPNCQINQIYGY